jgi:hypothetical protein
MAVILRQMMMAHETLPQKKKNTSQKRAGGVAQGVDLEFKP